MLRRLYRAVRKLRWIAASDLAGFDKIRYAARSFADAAEIAPYRLRGGGSVILRNGTTDSKVFDEIFVERAYAACVAGLPANLGPVTLIDVGANIGLSVLYLFRALGARALEVTEIIAVEPDPHNFRALLKNLEGNNTANRCTAVRAFAGTEHGFAEVVDSGNGAWGMRMGAPCDGGTPVLPLTEIAYLSNSRAAIVLKCDIEGGERRLFARIRDWEHLVRYIFLELHTEFLPVDELFSCLESSGFHWTVRGTPISTASIALFFLERTSRRNEVDP
jgi:FkbM family methyltransferase